jgi:hypothetical protein
MIKQAAEKARKMGEYSEMHPAVAEANPLLSASCGTTEVVPCYKTAHLLSKRTPENRRNH